MFARVLLRVALLAATFAWMGWGYLHTIGDPTRGEAIAVAVLDDAEARHELAAPIVNQLRFTAGVPPESIDMLTRAVAGALSDPDISGQVVSAFAAAHAQSLGVVDDRSTAIDVSAISVAIHGRVDKLAPDIAARIPNDIDLDVELPVLQVPYAADFRSTADATVRWIALAAAAGAIAAFLIGSPRRVLRRVGIWALVTGGVTVLATELWVLAARVFVPVLDSALEQGIRSATSNVVSAGWLLVAAGVASVVGSLFLAPMSADAPDGKPQTAAAPTPPPPPFPTPPPTPTPPGRPDPAGAAWTTAQTGERRAGRRFDDVITDEPPAWVSSGVPHDADRVRTASAQQNPVVPTPPVMPAETAWAIGPDGAAVRTTSTRHP